MTVAASPNHAGASVVTPVLHRWPVRIYYEDTDAEEIVYYANYLRYAERARAEWMRELGLSLATMSNYGIAFAVRRCEIDYLLPARLDDLLIVESHLTKLGGASIDAVQILKKDNTLIARMALVLVCIGPDKRPLRIPDWMRSVLKTDLGEAVEKNRTTGIEYGE